MSDRCTGLCCESFDLPLSPDQLAAEAAKRRERGTRYVGDPEIEQIAAMVVPIGQKANRTGALVWVYSCRHFDAKTRDCLNYEARPLMCRAFPYGQTCTFQGCTWDAVNARIARAEDVRPPVWLRLTWTRALRRRARGILLGSWA